MPCEASRSRQIEQQRQDALRKIEEELGQGIASITTNADGSVSVEGASIWPEGMADLCVLEALQTRGSLEYQLAAAAAGVQDRNFVAEHGHSHSH